MQLNCSPIIPVLRFIPADMRSIDTLVKGDPDEPSPVY